MIHQYFLEGQDAYDQLKHLAQNPYMNHTEPYRSWEAGFHDAWYADLDSL